MQKKLIALAVAGACAAPAAFAATSNVDIYGKLHASVNVYNDQPDGISDVGFSSNASRIGFKGSEDLGGGLSAVWQIETTVNMDEGGGFGGGRNTFVGLSGKSWGTAMVGAKHDTPLKGVGRAVDLFGDTIADSRNVLGGGLDTRADNVAGWMSPNWGGFSMFAAYSTEINNSTTAGDSDNADIWNVSGQYKNGPFYIGASYGDGDGLENLGLDNHWRVAGSFSMGDFKIVGQYDSLEADGTKAGDFDAWMIGGQYKMGAITFKANYMDGDWDDATDPNQWTIGVDYAFSKRTTVYALYADGENVVLGAGGGSSDRVGYSASTSSSAKDKDISAFSIGLVHTF